MNDLIAATAVVDYSRTTRRWTWIESRQLRWVGFWIVVVGSSYVGLYVILSACGRYEASSLKFDQVDWYQWAPAGFVQDYRRRDVLFDVFLPLYLVDRCFWHTDNDAWLSRYPRHVPENLGDLERAWKR